MSLLILGLLLWSGLHFIPSIIVQPLRNQLIEKLGEHPYKGLFSILVLTSVALMVLGLAFN